MAQQSRVRPAALPRLRCENAWMREGARMVRYRRNRVLDGTYFFTVTLRNRQGDALVRNVDALGAAWRSARSRTPHEAVAVVVLPDHLHAVIRMCDGGDYSRLWQDIK